MTFISVLSYSKQIINNAGIINLGSKKLIDIFLRWYYTFKPLNIGVVMQTP